MTKSKQDLKPNYAPLYAAAMYPDLAKICQSHGYALSVHGSLANDFDIVAIPWAKYVSKPEMLISSIQKKMAVKFTHKSKKKHGRIAYTVTVGFGVCRLDFSFFPSI